MFYEAWNASHFPVERETAQVVLIPVWELNIMDRLCKQHMKIPCKPASKSKLIIEVVLRQQIKGVFQLQQLIKKSSQL